MAAAPYRRTFVRLLGFLRPYKWSLAVSIILAVLSQAGQFGAAFLTGAGLANAVNGHDKASLRLIGLADRYSHVAHPLLRDVQQKMADVATVAEENIVGVHVVKSFAQEAAEQAKFERSSEQVFRQSVAANRQRALYVPLLSFLPLL